MKIHYISPFVDEVLLSEYLTTPSCNAKINYIKSSLKRNGFLLSLFSPVCCSSKSINFVSSREVQVDAQESHYYPFSFGCKLRFVRYISYIFIYFQLFLYLLLHVKRDEPVLIYHTLPDTKVIVLFEKLLNQRIYLEIEEIYSAVFKNDITSEIKLVNSNFKGYILVNSILPEKCLIKEPFIVCEGQYRSLSNVPKNIVDNSSKINLLYAGVFEKDADVFTAIKVSEYLDEKYVLHIAGYGNGSIVSEVEHLIQVVNEVSSCPIVFHGCLFGQQYEDLLSICSIGLCTRVLNDSLSDYTFPSKVFAYLSRNLKVVCTPISCVKKSPLSKEIVFSTSINPEDIANAILSIDKKLLIDNSSLLNFQDFRFLNDINELFYAKIITN